MPDVNSFSTDLEDFNGTAKLLSNRYDQIYAHQHHMRVPQTEDKTCGKLLHRIRFPMKY